MDIGKLVDIKLTGQSNWVDWKADILTLLRYKDSLGVIDGSLKRPEPISSTASAEVISQYEKELAKFNKADTCAILIIRSTLSTEIRSLIRMCPDDAKAIWIELCNHFEKKNDVRLSKLNQDFYKARQSPSESIINFVARVRTLWSELQREFQTELKIQLPEVLLVNKILSELPPEYAEFQTTWDGTAKEDRTIEELVNRLELRDARVLVNKENVLSDSAASVFVNKVFSKSRDKKNNSNRTFKGRCFKCNKFAGHLANECPETVTRKKNKYATDKVEECKNNVMYTRSSFISKSPYRDVWIKDDGATNHMTNSNEYFKSYDKFTKRLPIVIGDGTSNLYAYGRGSLDVKSEINGEILTFADVLYVPGLVKNCFSSVQSMLRGVSHVCNAKTKTVKFYYEGEKKILMEAKVKDGHLELQVQPVRQKNFSLVQKTCFLQEKPLPLSIWHQRLGHQGLKHIEQFLNHKNINFVKDNVFCEACLFGKQARRSFKSRQIRATAVGETVHADLCEPGEVSLGGNKYFLVLKDDFSKYREVIVLKNKSDTFSSLQTFIKRSELNGIKIKELLTDGGKEFNNQAVKNMLNESGIHLRTVMPYTHEQNGAAERENRTVVEMARTLLKSAELPNCLWAEAVSTTAYILNHTGKSSTVNKTPYEVWFNKNSPIKHLRIFGSVSYVHVPASKRKKMDSKSVKGVLIGYYGYDGYRIYIPEKKNVIMSTNVSFDEKLEGNELTDFEQKDKSSKLSCQVEEA